MMLPCLNVLFNRYLLELPIFCCCLCFMCVWFVFSLALLLLIQLRSALSIFIFVGRCLFFGMFLGERVRFNSFHVVNLSFIPLNFGCYFCHLVAGVLLGFCDVFSLAIKDLIYTKCEKVGIQWIKSGFPWFCFYLILNKHEKRQKLIEKVDTNYFSAHWISTALKPFTQTPAINLKSVKFCCTQNHTSGDARKCQIDWEKKEEFMKFWQWRRIFFSSTY